MECCFPFKLNRILNKQQHLHFNVPYDDDLYSYSDGLREGRREAEEWEQKFVGLKAKFDNFFDIPIQTELSDKFPWCGYITIEGKIYKCNQCEHEKIIRQIVLDEYKDEYLSVPASFYDHKPMGTFQEEYFAMKYLGFAKVSAFENAPTKRILFRYNNLTWKQSREIYPI